jgi:hypothetical protein
VAPTAAQGLHHDRKSSLKPSVFQFFVSAAFVTAVLPRTCCE